MVEFISMEPCTHPAGYVCSACCEGIRWFPKIRVEKYSVDQTAYAERKLADELSWGRKVELKTRQYASSAKGLLVDTLHGDWLRELFPEPEDGIATDWGNSLVNAGLTSIVYLLFSSVVAGTSTALKTGAVSGASMQTGGTISSGVGVGDQTTAWAASQAALSGNGANAWYQSMDATYPQWQGSGTPGQLNGQATYTSANANFAWQEWCWFVATSPSTGGNATLASAGTSPIMLNRKVTSLGTKGSGASWVFSQTVTFS